MLNLRGVDVEGVKKELQSFYEQTVPREESKGLSGLVRTTGPACGREQAVALSERVIPILDRLYPEWRRENARTSIYDDEFATERDACSRLLARIGSNEEIADLFKDHDDSPQLSAARMHELVWRAASAQWLTGHRHEAVLAAAKAVNSRLQEKLGRRDVSEVKLVREAFTDKAPTPGKPRLRFPRIEDDQTRESMRDGVMNFGVGCFQAIRNPVGHLPNERYELDEQAALERLAALSLLSRWIDEAELWAA